MPMDLAELVAVIEEEILVGEELRRNLEEQKKAVLVWDLVALLQQLEEREPWLRSLGDLEKRRQQAMKEMIPDINRMTLKELIAKFPSEAPERERLSRLREGARKIFTRLQADERYLQALIENLLAHIQEAWNPFLQSDVSIYGETGLAMPRSGPGLIQGKA